MFSTPFTFLKQPSAGGFSPADIPNLKSWHDSANVSTLTLSGTDVTEWRDASGNGFNLTVPVGKNPATYGDKTLNSIPVISSTVDSTLLKVASYGINAYIQGATVFFVGSQDTDPPDSNFGRFIGAGAKQQFWYGKYGTNVIAGGFLSNNDKGLAATPNQFYTVTGIGTTTDTYLYLNGNSAVTSTPKVYSEVYSDVGMAFFGEFSGGGITSVRKALAEVIIYDRLLNASELQQVEDYLQAKWAHY